MSEQTVGTLGTSYLTEIARSTKARDLSHDSAPAVRIQQMIFQEAAVLEASDIHVEPRASMTSVRYRINGRMKDGPEIPRWMHDNLVARIKVLAKLDISEKRVPQDGHIAAD